MFTLEIATDNDAFYEHAGTEIARILRDVADQVEDRTTAAEGLLRDVNGARVGTWRLDVSG